MVIQKYCFESCRCRYLILYDYRDIVVNIIAILSLGHGGLIQARKSDNKNNLLLYGAFRTFCYVSLLLKFQSYISMLYQLTHRIFCDVLHCLTTCFFFFCVTAFVSYTVIFLLMSSLLLVYQHNSNFLSDLAVCKSSLLLVFCRYTIHKYIRKKIRLRLSSRDIPN